MVGKEQEILKIAKVRSYLREKNYSACIIPQSDPHLSEYVSDYYKVREFFSGFNGSAGTLVVGLDYAKLWTDGRYFLQAEVQLAGTGIELCRSGEENVPSIEAFLAEKVGKEGKVVANANVISAKKWEEMAEKFNLVHDNEWEILSGLISDALHSFIPMAERADEEMSIADNSDLMELVDIPEITNMVLEIDEANGAEYQSLSYLLKYVY